MEREEIGIAVKPSNSPTDTLQTPQNRSVHIDENGFTQIRNRKHANYISPLHGNMAGAPPPQYDPTREVVGHVTLSPLTSLIEDPENDSKALTIGDMKRENHALLEQFTNKF